MVVHRQVHWLPHGKTKITPKDEEERKVFSKLDSVLTSPLQWHAEFGPKGDRAWVGALPMFKQLLLQHARRLFEGGLNEQLKGCLSSPPAGGLTGEIFAKNPTIASELAKVYTEYGRATGTAQQDEKDDAKDTKVKDEKQKNDDDMGKVKTDALQLAGENLETRWIVLCPDVNNATSIEAIIRAQSIVKLDRRMMAFFDCKNSALARVYPGQSKFSRVPLVDETQIENFGTAVSKIMRPGKDVFYVLSGRLVASPTHHSMDVSSTRSLCSYILIKRLPPPMEIIQQ